jgi:hypothetical protein
MFLHFIFSSPIGGAQKGEALQKFATICLFVETMPIYKDVASGNGNIEFYRETTRSNLKLPSIATMPDRT